MRRSGEEDPSVPPREGDTDINDCPVDCFGIIMSFLSDSVDILSFVNTSKQFFYYFREREIIKKITFSVNLGFVPTAKKRYMRFVKEKKEEEEKIETVEFIHRLNFPESTSQFLTVETFSIFPNLTFLDINFSPDDRKGFRCLSTSIFKYFPNLEEFYTKGKFVLNNECINLSMKIRIISILNLTDNYYRRRYKEKIRNDYTNNFFKVLLERPFLEEIHISRLLRNVGGDFRFIKFLKTLTKLRKLSLTNKCSPSKLFLSDQSFIPENLEELNIKDMTPNKYFKDKFLIPTTLKVLKINSKLYGLESLSHFLQGLSKRTDGGEIRNLQILDVSNTIFKQSILDFFEKKESIDDIEMYNEISKLFPNLKKLIAEGCGIKDRGIEYLMTMKELETVHFSYQIVIMEEMNLKLLKVESNTKIPQTIEGSKIKFFVVVSEEEKRPTSHDDF